MATVIVHPKNQKQLAAVEAILNALDVTFKKEEDSYDPDFVAKIEKSRAEVKAGKTSPADIMELRLTETVKEEIRFFLKTG